MNEIPDLDRITDRVLGYRPTRKQRMEKKQMAEIRDIPVPDGGTVRAIEKSFDLRSEPWSEYELSDGGRLRFKAAITRIWQVLDDNEEPVRLPNGDLFIIVESTNLVTVDTT